MRQATGEKTKPSRAAATTTITTEPRTKNKNSIKREQKIKTVVTLNTLSFLLATVATVCAYIKSNSIVAAAAAIAKMYAQFSIDFVDSIHFLSATCTSLAGRTMANAITCSTQQLASALLLLFVEISHWFAFVCLAGVHAKGEAKEKWNQISYISDDYHVFDPSVRPSFDRRQNAVQVACSLSLSLSLYTEQTQFDACVMEGCGEWGGQGGRIKEDETKWNKINTRNLLRRSSLSFFFLFFDLFFSMPTPSRACEHITTSIIQHSRHTSGQIRRVDWNGTNGACG